MGQSQSFAKMAALACLVAAAGSGYVGNLADKAIATNKAAIASGQAVKASPAAPVFSGSASDAIHSAESLLLAESDSVKTTKLDKSADNFPRLFVSGTYRDYDAFKRMLGSLNSGKHVVSALKVDQTDFEMEIQTLGKPD